MDLIERKAAIDLIERMKPYQLDGDDCIEIIANMPSAQPEVIRCKDCKYYTPIKRTDRWWCRCEEGLWHSSNDDFCSKAERKQIYD